MTHRPSDVIDFDIEIDFHACDECGEAWGPWLADKNGERFCPECA